MSLWPYQSGDHQRPVTDIPGIKNLNLKSKISHPLPNDPLHKSDTPSSGHAQMNAQISDYGIVTRKVVICTYMNTIGIP